MSDEMHSSNDVTLCVGKSKLEYRSERNNSKGLIATRLPNLLAIFRLLFVVTDLLCDK